MRRSSSLILIGLLLLVAVALMIYVVFAVSLGGVGWWLFSGAAALFLAALALCAAFEPVPADDGAERRPAPARERL